MALTFPEADPADVARIEAWLGHPLAARFRVAVRRVDGTPVVIENEPHLRDGTPMPTLYWLVDPALHDAVSRLEGEAGVHRYEDLVDADDLAATHAGYATLRQARIVRTDLVAPSGGVGGTRTGVKCLHAHLAYYVTGAHDPVGQLVAETVGLPTLVRIEEES